MVEINTVKLNAFELDPNKDYLIQIDPKEFYSIEDATERLRKLRDALAEFGYTRCFFALDNLTLTELDPNKTYLISVEVGDKKNERAIEDMLNHAREIVNAHGLNNVIIRATTNGVPVFKFSEVE